MLALMCYSSKRTIDEIQNDFLKGKLVNANALSKASFIAQADIIINKFYATMDMTVTPSYAAELVAFIIVHSRNLHSALHTDVFTWSVPGSDQFNTVSNFYPRHDNASFSYVSFLREALCECQQNRSEIHVVFQIGLDDEKDHSILAWNPKY